MAIAGVQANAPTNPTPAPAPAQTPPANQPAPPAAPAQNNQHQPGRAQRIAELAWSFMWPVLIALGVLVGHISLHHEGWRNDWVGALCGFAVAAILYFIHLFKKDEKNQETAQPAQTPPQPTPPPPPPPPAPAQPAFQGPAVGTDPATIQRPNPYPSGTPASTTPWVDQATGWSWSWNGAQWYVLCDDGTTWI